MRLLARSLLVLGVAVFIAVTGVVATLSAPEARAVVQPNGHNIIHLEKGALAGNQTRGVAVLELTGVEGEVNVTIQATKLPLLDSLPLARTGAVPDSFVAYTYPLTSFDYGFGYPEERSLCVCWRPVRMTQGSDGLWTAHFPASESTAPSMLAAVFVVAADSADPDNHVDPTMVVLSSLLGQRMNLEP